MTATRREVKPWMEMMRMKWQPSTMWLKRQQTPNLARVQAGQMPWQKCSTKRYHKISPSSWPRVKNWRRREKRKNKRGWRRGGRWEKDSAFHCTISQVGMRQDPLSRDLGQHYEPVLSFGISTPLWPQVASISWSSRQSCSRVSYVTVFFWAIGQADLWRQSFWCQSAWGVFVVDRMKEPSLSSDFYLLLLIWDITPFVGIRNASSSSSVIEGENDKGQKTVVIQILLWLPKSRPHGWDCSNPWRACGLVCSPWFFMVGIFCDDICALNYSQSWNCYKESKTVGN